MTEGCLLLILYIFARPVWGQNRFYLNRWQKDQMRRGILSMLLGSFFQSALVIHSNHPELGLGEVLQVYYSNKKMLKVAME